MFAGMRQPKLLPTMCVIALTCPVRKQPIVANKIKEICILAILFTIFFLLFFPGLGELVLEEGLKFELLIHHLEQ
jgi:hypothetical protein